MVKSKNQDEGFELIKVKAEFIKQNLLSSGKEEYDEKDVVVKDLSDLIHRLNMIASFGGLPVNIKIEDLPTKFIRRSSYKKEDLIYRVDEVLTVVNSLLKTSQETKSCSSCNAQISTKTKFCGECGVKL